MATAAAGGTRPDRSTGETVRAFLRDVRTGERLERVGEYLAPRVRAHQGPPGRATAWVDRTPEQYAEHVREMQAATGPWAFEVVGLEPAGDVVDAQWRQRGTSRAPGPDHGAEVVEHGRARYVVRSGRITEYWLDVRQHVGPCGPTTSCGRDDG